MAERLKSSLAELKEKDSLTEEEEAYYKEVFSLDDKEALELLRWILKLEKCPCWD